jgi:signal transduction histidine kinase
VNLSIPALLGLMALAALSGGLAASRIGTRRHRTHPPAESGAHRELSPHQALAELSRTLAASDDLDQVIERCLSILAQATGAERAAVQLATPGSERLLHWASHDAAQGPQPVARPLSAERSHGLAGWVIEHRKSALIPDVSLDRRWIPFPGANEDHHSALAVPLLAGTQALGACLLLGRSPKVFTPEDRDLATAGAALMAFAIRLAEARRSLHEAEGHTEDAVRHQQADLRRAQAILESIADGVVVTGPGHQVAVCNAAAERILRLPRATVLGAPAAQFIGLYGPAGRRWADALQAWSQDPASATEQPTHADRLDLEDGRVIEVHVAPVVLGTDFLGTVAVFRDISRDVEIDQLKSDFVATVSHELRTPMTSIRGYVQMLLLEAAGPLTDEQRKFLETIRTNSDRLGRLVNDLLDLSRLESGDEELHLQPVAPLPVLEAGRDYLAARCVQDAKGLRVELEVPASLPEVRADPLRLQQILRGLLDNSFNFTPAGGTVWIRAQPDGERLRIEVADSGTGIPRAEQPRVFERFFRGEQALNLGVPGTGLGLSIVAHLVELHGATIELRSEGVPGQGTRFSFALPLAPSPAGG